MKKSIEKVPNHFFPFFVLVSLTLFLGFFAGRFYQPLQIISESTNVEFVSPTGNSKVSGTTGILLKSNVKRGEGDLVSYYKIDDESVRPLLLKRADDGLLMIRSSFDTKKYKNGTHNLTVLLYRIKENSISTVAKKNIPFEISN